MHFIPVLLLHQSQFLAMFKFFVQHVFVLPFTFIDFSGQIRNWSASNLTLSISHLWHQLSQRMPRSLLVVRFRPIVLLIVMCADMEFGEEWRVIESG
jgi:hypothetical protein